MEAFNKEFERNRFGIKIVKCCASCKHHAADGRESIRICMDGRGEHHLDYLCDGGWEMAEGLDNVGKGGGCVKKKEYLYMIAQASAGGIMGREKLEAIRDAYRRKYGSEYLTKK